MPLTHLALVLLLVLVWGFNFVMIRIGLEGFPPLLLCCARFFFTSLPAVFFVRFPNASFKKIALYSLFMFVLQYALLFTGMYAGIAPGLASLLVQSQVFFTTLLAILFLGETLRPWQVFGGIVAFSGIVLIGVNTSGSVTTAGLLLVVASAAAWASGNLISKQLGRVNALALVVWASLFAWPPMLLLSLLVEGPERIASSLLHLSWHPLVAALYIAYFSTIFGFATWSWLIRQHPLPTVAPFSLLVPIIAMGSSIAVLGEPLQEWKIEAGLLVIAGLCVNLFGPRFFKKKRI